jgi:hypothetical protein
VHFSSTGAVMWKGTWKATGFTSFTGFGGRARGDEGGALSIVVTHYCKAMGMTMTGIPMTVTSTRGCDCRFTYEPRGHPPCRAGRRGELTSRRGVAWTGTETGSAVHCALAPGVVAAAASGWPGSVS